MNKQDIKRNLPWMTGNLGNWGYVRWCHSFTGIGRESGRKRRFFVEYCILNPGIGREEPIMGDKRRHQRPSYMLVRAGFYGKDGVCLNKYYGIGEVDAPARFLKITAGECFLSEDNIWGRIRSGHSMMWSLRVNRRVSFHVAYSRNCFVREINPQDMYWSADGMRTEYEGIVVLDGESYDVKRKGCHGYADKKWGRDYTCPWFWLYGNEMESIKYGKPLSRSAFAIGGGNPVVLGIPMRSKVYANIFYEGKNYVVDETSPWTLPRMRYACGVKGGRAFWHVKAENLAVAMEIKIHCGKDELQEVRYQTPDGKWNRNRMLGGGTGRGEILLYRRSGMRYRLVDKIVVRDAGCEFTVKR